MNPEHAPWKAGEVNQLGTALDRVIAKRLGRTVEAVRSARRYHSVPPYRLAKISWTKVQIAMLGKHTDAGIAARLGVAPITVTRKRLALKISAFGVTRWKKFK